MTRKWSRRSASTIALWWVHVGWGHLIVSLYITSRCSFNWFSKDGISVHPFDSFHGEGAPIHKGQRPKRTSNPRHMSTPQYMSVALVCGRKRFYNTLKQKSASFRVMDCPIPCLESILKGLPATFHRPITFRVKSRDEKVHILMIGIRSESTPISGFPQSLRQLVSAQGLLLPFGSIDHRKIERPLPCVPLKRKLANI